MRRLLLFSAAVILAFSAAKVSAVPTTDSFSITKLDEYFISGSGTGYNDGTGVEGTPWYYYPNTQWYNQWFYDAPPDPTRYKEITYDIHISPVSTVWLTIAINWSTLAYPEAGPGGPPPLPGLFDTPYEWLEDVFIARKVIFNQYVGGYVNININGTLIIPDYNPEWVSIDFRVEKGGAFVEGTITHECIPAPGAIVLGSIGIGLIGWLRRRRTL